MYAVHGKDVQSYWSKNINPSHIENINWATVEKAGKFLKRWKESDTDA